MKTQRLKALAVLAVLGVLMLPSSATRAQSGPPCDDPDATCSPWKDLGFQQWMTDNDCQISVASLKVRVCVDANGNAEPEISYTGLTLTSLIPGGCDYFKDSSIWQLVDIGALDRISNLESNGTLGRLGVRAFTIPNCPTLGPEMQVQFITTACYIWQMCEYTTTGGNPDFCNPPENNPGPPPNSKVDVWTWHDCGTACCKRIYEICNNPPPPTGVGGFSIHVDLISKSIVNPPGCSGNVPNPGGTWVAQCNSGC